MALKPTNDLITTKEPWVTLDMAVHGEPLHEQRCKPRAGAAPEAVEDEEAL